MSDNVDFDASKPVCDRVERTPSEVLLALILEHVKTFNSQYREFNELMKVWTQVKELEASAEIYLEAEREHKRAIEDFMKELRGPKETQIDQHTFLVEDEDPAAGITPVESRPVAPQLSQNVKKPKNETMSAAGKSSFAKRKQAILDAVKSARASGCTLQGIADQSDLQLSCVMDLINGVAKPVRDWTKLEKGLKKLGHPPRPIPKEEEHEQEG